MRELDGHVLGLDRVSTPDPTEDYHEASRAYPGIVDPEVRGAAQLERSIEMRASAARSVKRHPAHPFRPLPEPRLGRADLGRALALRRSHRAFDDRAVGLGDLATILHAAYGVTGALADAVQALRTVPSGGALYPLELYVAAAGLDEYVPPEMVDDLERHLRDTGVRARVERYPGVHHGFAFPTRHGAYDRPACDRHWERLFDLFDRNLRA